MIQESLFQEMSLTKGEVEAWHRKPDVMPSEWAEENYVVLRGPYQGRWSNELTPYLVDIMNTAAQPWVRTVVVVGPTQSGKTQILYILWGFMVDINDVSLAMHIMADQKTARRIGKQVFCRQARKSPALKRMLTGSPRDLSSEEINLAGHTLFMAWPSETQLETHSAELVELDETDAFKGYKKGARLSDPIARAKGRTESFKHTGKVVAVSKCSTEAGPIWRELMKCQVQYVRGVVCPACGRWQIPELNQLKWDESLEADPGRVEAENLAWYECENPDCPEPHWHEMERKKAERAGSYRPAVWDSEKQTWQPLPGDPPERPISVGFNYGQFSAFSFVPLGKIAASAIRAKLDVAEKHDLYNKRLARPYRQDRALKKEDYILELCDERIPGQAGIVPRGTVLIATIDRQKYGRYFLLCAWRPGRERRGYLVRAGYTDADEVLERALFKDQYPTADNEPVPLSFGLYDAGYEPTEVHDWCENHPPIKPSKGVDTVNFVFRWRTLETHPGLHQASLNSNHFKNDLDSKLRIKPGNPGAFSLHSNTGIDPVTGLEQPGLLNDFAKHMCSEMPDEHGKWQKVYDSIRNDFLDLMYMQLAAVEILQLRYAEPEPETASPHEEAPPAQVLRPDPNRARQILLNRRNR
jgi:phage terminase large subunit GpA-like protein